MLTELSYRHKSELDLLRTKVMFVAYHPKQGNLLKGWMEGQEDTGSSSPWMYAGFQR